MELGKTYHVISDVYCDSGDLDFALKYAQKFYSISRDEGSSVEIQRATATLGRVYYLMGSEAKKEKDRSKNLNKSLEFYNLSQSVVESLCGSAQKNELVEMRACLHLNVALLYDEWGKFGEAEKRYKSAASLSQVCRSRDTEIKALLGLSTLKFNQSKFEEAILAIHECLRCCKKCSDKSLFVSINILHGKPRPF
ncbi:hypothetical protein MXB_5584 [Myxobolus squamalis]|nr:hypothetical protein MXB_5584 [Myxobolus squamalis]